MSFERCCVEGNFKENNEMKSSRKETFEGLVGIRAVLISVTHGSIPPNAVQCAVFPTRLAAGGQTHRQANT